MDARDDPGERRPGSCRTLPGGHKSDLGTSWGIRIPLPEDMESFIDTSAPAQPQDAVRVLSRYSQIEAFCRQC